MAYEENPQNGCDINARVANLKQPAICCVGPTASGKTAFAQQLALHLNGEVVSADSMQIYRGMDIGTGKIRPQEMLVPHFGLDILDPGMPYSASLFQDYARACFCDIDKRGKRAVLCGGTGFYVRAAIDDYRFPKGEQVGNEIRDRYKAVLQEKGPQALWEMLQQADPESAELIAPNDSKRVIRAFEMLEDGTTYARQKENLADLPQLVPAVFFGLQVDPAVLRARIDARVDAMVQEGLVQEVQGLLEAGFRQGITAPQAIGYKEIVEYLDGNCSLEQAIQQIKTATHQYAKRQRTWFRKESRAYWISADELNVDDMIQQALAHLAKIQGDREGEAHV